MPLLNFCVKRRAALLLCLAAAQGTALAQDAAIGRQKAQLCSVCHGPIGISSGPDVPHLAGQPAVYLALQLRAYRNGSRRHEVMGVIAKPLSDEDINALAAWFSSIHIEAQAPQ